MNRNPDILNLLSTDTLYCHLDLNGKSLMSFNVSGIKCIAELYRFIRIKVADIKGLIVLTLRNVSQGWSDRFSLCLK